MPRASDSPDRRSRANGEGSIYQRSSDGRWVSSAYVYTTAGVRKRRAIYGASFNEVREKLDRLKGNSANGVLVPDRATTLGEYLDHWLREVVGHKRATTARGYESAVRLHIKPVLGKKRLDKLTGAEVRHLMAVCRQKCLCCINGLRPASSGRQTVLLRRPLLPAPPVHAADPVHPRRASQRPGECRAGRDRDAQRRQVGPDPCTALQDRQGSAATSGQQDPR